MPIDAAPSSPEDPSPSDSVRAISLCPCKSKRPYGECCMPFHHGRAKPETAEALMRSRYAAFFFRRVDYLVDTTHPSTRSKNLRQDLEQSIHEYQWSFLRILHTSKGQSGDPVGKVEFVADFYLNGEPHQLHERSRFKRYKGAWKYLDDKG